MQYLPLVVTESSYITLQSFAFYVIIPYRVLGQWGSRRALLAERRSTRGFFKE